MTSDAQILAPPPAPGEQADPRRWLTLTILLLAAFMNLLDISTAWRPSAANKSVYEGRDRATGAAKYTATAVDQQSGATTEIARNVQQAAIGTDEVSSNITGVLEAAAETGEHARTALDNSDQLSQQAMLVDTFPPAKRAAPPCAAAATRSRSCP